MARDRLRIAHVICTSSFAGAERAVTISARAMADRGHHVTVLGGEPAAMAHHLADAAISLVPISGLRGAVKALRELDGLDVVHAHMTAAEAAVLLSGTHRRAAFVVTRHFAQQRGSSPIGRVVRMGMNRVAHTEVAISRYVADRIAEPSTVIHFGLPDSGAVALQAKTVVAIQRLEAEKDTITAVRAWSRSRFAGEGWKLEIAGDGSERDILEREAASLGVGSSIEFLGRVTDVDSLRARASIQLATPPGEHFGLSVLEAMAAGLPVIAADGGAHRELLGDDGVYFTPGDADALTAALDSMHEDLGSLGQIGAALQARQRAKFSLAAHGELLEFAYRSL
ncbi:MAG: glycosyltransferase [Acidimicrobiia bacterium]